MIEIVAQNLAQYIYVKSSKNISIAVMKYALTYILNFSFTLILCLLIGFLTGKLVETILAFSAAVILRLYSGGYHFSSIDICTIVSSFVISILPHLQINNIFNIPFAFVSIVIMIFCNKAPKNKFISILIICSNFFINSNVLGLVFLVQSLTIIPKRG